MARHSIAVILTDEERHELARWRAAYRTPQQVALRCRIVMAAAAGQQDKTIAISLGINSKTVALWRHRFRHQGPKCLWKIASGRGRKPVFQQSDLKNVIFTLMHSPPSQHNINRTSWRLEDVHQRLLAQGIDVSRASISRIVRAAGYTWRKTTEVLTSNDPQYQERLERIKSVLSMLGENDRFCSIDEYGPFAIKMKGGTKLVGPGEHPHVPQSQKSKGRLILTAALELSRNQVIHFYSNAKNTIEMIRLLDVLLQKYRGCDTLYLSWDAASWHASEALYKKVESVNTLDVRCSAHTPRVELIPLPSSAQYLNVIESVFSGMARAIIHNSDYQSVEDAMAAIDRYFLERNDYFEKNPKRAGNKIWGRELVVSKFSESNNCKDRRYR